MLIFKKTLAFLRRVLQAYYKYHAGIAGYDLERLPDGSTRVRVSQRNVKSTLRKTLKWTAFWIIVIALITLLANVLG